MSKFYNHLKLANSIIYKYGTNIVTFEFIKQIKGE